MKPATSNPSLTRFRRALSYLLVLAVAVHFFLAPAFLIARGLRDPGLGSAQVPSFVWSWHRALAPRFARWARQRVASGEAASVAHLDVSGTEWPMFGAIFFLEATEALDDARAAAGLPVEGAPRRYAADAIEAAAELVVDPRNAAWVEKYWGEDYLQRENVFYRMLLIRGLTIHSRLTGSHAHEALLREQSESLAAELLAAPSGFLDDYPNQAFPNDVLWAVVAIRKADAILGSDHSVLAERFLAKSLEPRALGSLGLPPYMINARSGVALDDSRGCTNTGLLTQAPFLSAAQASRWYQLYADHFWQRRAGMAGFAEFPHRDDIAFYNDVDSGPVIWGYGLAASAFGLGAARANGRFDHARPLAGLALVFSWPLPGGDLLVPRFFANAIDAPLIGESGLLFAFTRAPQPGVALQPGGSFPPLVFVFLTAYTTLGAALAWTALRGLHATRREVPRTGGAPLFVVWLAAAMIGAGALALGSIRVGCAALALAIAAGTRR